MYDRILIATDGSKLSRKAVAHALDLARVHGAQLVALHVVPRYPQSYFEGGIAMSNDEMQRVEQQWRARGQAIVDQVAEEAARVKIQVKPVVSVDASPSAAILKTATRHRCDLIVMASHGRKGIARVLLGSEAQQVLTHSTLPVLVIR